MDALKGLLLSVRFDHDRLHELAARGDCLADFFDCAGDARIDRRGDVAARLTDELSDLDCLARLYDRDGRRADVH